MNTKNTAQALAQASKIGILCYSSGHPIATSLKQLSRKILDGAIVPAKSACGFRASKDTINAAKAAHVAEMIASHDTGHGATLWRKQSREFNALVLEAWGVDSKDIRRKACSVAWEDITPADKAAKATQARASVGSLVKAAQAKATQAKVSTHKAAPAPFTPIRPAVKIAGSVEDLRAQAAAIAAAIAEAEAEAAKAAKAAEAAKAEAAQAKAEAAKAAKAEAATRAGLAGAAGVVVSESEVGRMIEHLAILAPYGIAPEFAVLRFVVSGVETSIPVPAARVAEILGALNV